MNPSEMTKAEKSMLLYLESCAVDASGLAEGIRMNAEDMEAAKRFKVLGLAELHRIPSHLLGGVKGKQYTHWVKMSDAGFALAHQLRRERADRKVPGYATDVVEALTEIGKITESAAA